jgi:hypothetical protein
MVMMKDAAPRQRTFYPLDRDLSSPSRADGMCPAAQAAGRRG